MTQAPSTKSPAPGYSSVRQGGNTLYLAGTLGLSPETRAIAAGGIEAEIHQMMKNVATACEGAGFSMNDIVSTTVYVTTFDFYETFDAIYQTYFEKPLPARATVQVAGLVAGASVEITAIAHKDNS